MSQWKEDALLMYLFNVPECVNEFHSLLHLCSVSKQSASQQLTVLVAARLLELPACLAVAVLGLLADTLLITLVALVKSPLLLFKGWGRLLHDLIGRHGACLEAACVPFAGLALVLWPVVTVVAVLLAIISSPILGLFGAVVVYQVR